jgi:acyl carrier protein
MDGTTTLTAGSIKTSVRAFIVENFLFGQADEGLTDDVSFLGVGIIDSTGILELVTFIEERYEIQIEDDEMLPENLDSLDNVSAFVLRKLGEQ